MTNIKLVNRRQKTSRINGERRTLALQDVVLKDVSKDMRTQYVRLLLICALFLLVAFFLYLVDMQSHINHFSKANFCSKFMDEVGIAEFYPTIVPSAVHDHHRTIELLDHDNRPGYVDLQHKTSALRPVGLDMLSLGCLYEQHMRNDNCYKCSTGNSTIKTKVISPQCQADVRHNLEFSVPAYRYDMPFDNNSTHCCDVYDMRLVYEGKGVVHPEEVSEDTTLDDVTFRVFNEARRMVFSSANVLNVRIQNDTKKTVVEPKLLVVQTPDMKLCFDATDVVNRILGVMPQLGDVSECNVSKMPQLQQSLNQTFVECMFFSYTANSVAHKRNIRQGDCYLRSSTNFAEALLEANSTLALPRTIGTVDCGVYFDVFKIMTFLLKHSYGSQIFNCTQDVMPDKLFVYAIKDIEHTLDVLSENFKQMALFNREEAATFYFGNTSDNLADISFNIYNILEIKHLVDELRRPDTTEGIFGLDAHKTYDDFYKTHQNKFDEIMFYLCKILTRPIFKVVDKHQTLARASDIFHLRAVVHYENQKNQYFQGNVAVIKSNLHREVFPVVRVVIPSTSSLRIQSIEDIVSNKLTFQTVVDLLCALYNAQNIEVDDLFKPLIADQVREVAVQLMTEKIINPVTYSEQTQHNIALLYHWPVIAFNYTRIDRDTRLINSDALAFHDMPFTSEEAEAQLKDNNVLATKLTSDLVKLIDEEQSFFNRTNPNKYKAAQIYQLLLRYSIVRDELELKKHDKPVLNTLDKEVIVLRPFLDFMKAKLGYENLTDERKKELHDLIDVLNTKELKVYALPKVPYAYACSIHESGKFAYITSLTKALQSQHLLHKDTPVCPMWFIVSEKDKLAFPCDYFTVKFCHLRKNKDTVSYAAAKFLHDLLFYDETGINMLGTQNVRLRVWHNDKFYHKMPSETELKQFTSALRQPLIDALTTEVSNKLAGTPHVKVFSNETGVTVDVNITIPYHLREAVREGTYDDATAEAKIRAAQFKKNSTQDVIASQLSTVPALLRSMYDAQVNGVKNQMFIDSDVSEKFTTVVMQELANLTLYSELRKTKIQPPQLQEAIIKELHAIKLEVLQNTRVSGNRVIVANINNARINQLLIDLVMPKFTVCDARNKQMEYVAELQTILDQQEELDLSVLPNLHTTAATKRLSNFKTHKTHTLGTLDNLQHLSRVALETLIDDPK